MVNANRWPLSALIASLTKISGLSLNTNAQATNGVLALFSAFSHATQYAVCPFVLKDATMSNICALSALYR